MSDSYGTVAEREAGGKTPVLPRRRKTGGRKKGTPNKRTVERNRQLADLKFSGQDPITFFTAIMRDEEAPYEERKYAAAELLPYYHPKLSSIEARTGGASHEDRLQRLLSMMEGDRPRSAEGSNNSNNGAYPLLTRQRVAHFPGA
jgi:hypothetical protein